MYPAHFAMDPVYLLGFLLYPSMLSRLRFPARFFGYVLPYSPITDQLRLATTFSAFSVPYFLL